MRQKARQTVETGLTTAWLTLRAVIPGKTKSPRVGPVITVDPNWCQPDGRRRDPVCHHRIPPASPAAPCGHAPVDAELHLLDNAHAG